MYVRNCGFHQKINKKRNESLNYTSEPSICSKIINQAIDEIGTSVWNWTAGIITHSVVKLFIAAAADSDSGSDSNNSQRLSSSSQVQIWVCAWIWGFLGFLKMDCRVSVCILTDVRVYVSCFCVWLTRKIYYWVCVCVSGFVIFGF